MFGLGAHISDTRYIEKWSLSTGWVVPVYRQIILLYYREEKVPFVRPLYSSREVKDGKIRVAAAQLVAL